MFDPAVFRVAASVLAIDLYAHLNGSLHLPSSDKLQICRIAGPGD